MDTENGTVTLDELLSRPGWRESLHGSHTALKEAANLWLSESSLIISLEGLRYMDAGDTKLPQGYEGLTKELCKWCDVGQTSIDPSPLLRFLRQVVNLLELNQLMLLDRREDAIDKLSVLFDDAWDVLDRMLNAAFEQAGEEPPEVLFKRLVPGLSTKRVIDLIEEGLDNGAVCAKSGKSVGSVRQTRSRLKKGRYDLDS